MAITFIPKRQVNTFVGRQNALHGLTGILVLMALGFGLYRAKNSSLFHLNEVRVAPLSDHYPLSASDVLKLASVPGEGQSLFDLDLLPIEKRLSRHAWVKGVVLSKQFPNTVMIQVIERKPIALLAEKSGRVLYLEEDGTTFLDQAMVYSKELPILTGFAESSAELLKRLNSFIEEWFDSETFPGLKLSTMSYDPKLGLKAMILLPMKNGKTMRATLELGLDLEEARLIPKARLKKVLDYLSERSEPASKIWLGDGKKIVVKF